MTQEAEDIPAGSSTTSHEEERERPVDRPLVRRQVICTLTACLSSLTFGMVQGYSSPTMAAIVSDGILAEDQLSWFTSIAILGVAVGGLSAGVLVSALGRKTTLMVACPLFAIGWVVIAAADGVIMLCIGRVITGIPAGISAVCVPTYISEISSKHIRGTLVALMSFIIFSAIALTYTLGIFLPWRWLAVVGCAIPAIQVCAILFVPETPRWLLTNYRSIEARQVLQWLRGPDFDITPEFNEMEDSAMDSDKKISCGLLTDPPVYKSVLVVFGLMFHKQASGRCAIIFFATKIFDGAGWSGNAHLPSVIMALCQVGAVVVACVLVDRVGRKPLLVVTTFILTASCVTLGLAFWLKGNIPDISWLSLASLLVYIAAFANGLGPIPQLIMVEIIPTRLRGPVSGLAIFLNWMTAFLVTSVYLTLVDTLGTYGTFWMFGVVNFVGAIFILITVKETTGKTLEEMETVETKRGAGEGDVTNGDIE